MSDMCEALTKQGPLPHSVEIRDHEGMYWVGNVLIFVEHDGSFAVVGGMRYPVRFDQYGSGLGTDGVYYIQSEME